VLLTWLDNRTIHQTHFQGNWLEIVKIKILERKLRVLSGINMVLQGHLYKNSKYQHINQLLTQKLLLTKEQEKRCAVKIIVAKNSK